MPTLFLITLIVVLALIFDFLNGANDRANSIATVTATKALSPTKALILASVFNMAGAFVSTKVAKTIGKGIISSENLTLSILIFGILGAIVWIFICTKSGIPISVSHSLVGGIMGAGIMALGTTGINWQIVNNKVFLAIILGPTAGFMAGSLLFVLLSWTLFLFFKKSQTQKIEKTFKKLQIISASFVSFTHGMNDTQNAMGIITAALLSGGLINSFVVPLWVKIACGLAMGIGTFLMGWKVMKTLGWKLAKLEPKHGFVAETGAGIIVGLHSIVGMPVSTTHVIGSSVLGGTFLQNRRRIKYPVAGKMIIAWLITIPCAGAVSALSYLLLNPFIV